MTERVSTGSSTSSNKMAEQNDCDRLGMIEYIVNKRHSNFEYLKKIHEGGAFWLNCVKIAQEDILTFYGNPATQARAEKFFILGTSVAPLLHLQNGIQYIRALAQLIEEYDYNYASTTMKSVMKIKSRADGDYVDDEDAPIRPSMIKKDNVIIYQYLQTPHVPCELDYFEVLSSLCDVLTLVYRKFVDPSSANPSIYDVIVRIDQRIKHHVISSTSMDISRVATKIAQEDSRLIDDTLGNFVAATTRSVGVKDMLSMLTGN
eukprot:c52687_g1_i1.p1 GENE.c52687_g1_i1~~c52687_g1_i1.p1  ORF type:complete len:261 (+),score=62.18 c52687_g1_i1:120-902(+)